MFYDYKINKNLCNISSFSKKISKFALMKLIADSGSTKTDWCIFSEEDVLQKITTNGINPYQLGIEEIEGIIKSELIEALRQRGLPTCFDAIEFYGAGCNSQKVPVMSELLGRLFPECQRITVDSDMLGACKALCGNSEGICCILGTGANSCLYNGSTITENVPPMGFILGDEGSGAVIGRTFVNEIYKGYHRDMIPLFEQETGLNAAIITQKVYRESMPGRFLASLNLFIGSHRREYAWLNDMITECFRNFFRKNVRHYNRPDLAVSFVGSIAFHYQDLLKKAADLEGYEIGRIIKSPL